MTEPATLDRRAGLRVITGIEDARAHRRRKEITDQLAQLPPVADNTDSGVALRKLTAWCKRPGPRNSAEVAFWAIALLEENAKLTRMLDAAMRATSALLELQEERG